MGRSFVDQLEPTVLHINRYVSFLHGALGDFAIPYIERQSSVICFTADMVITGNSTIAYSAINTELVVYVWIAAAFTLLAGHTTTSPPRLALPSIVTQILSSRQKIALVGAGAKRHDEQNHRGVGDPPFHCHLPGGRSGHHKSAPATHAAPIPLDQRYVAQLHTMFERRAQQGKKAKKQARREQSIAASELDGYGDWWDDELAFIAGRTSWGFAYGVRWEELPQSSDLPGQSHHQVTKGVGGGTGPNAT